MQDTIAEMRFGGGFKSFRITAKWLQKEKKYLIVMSFACIQIMILSHKSKRLRYVNKQTSSSYSFCMFFFQESFVILDVFFDMNIVFQIY